MASRQVLLHRMDAPTAPGGIQAGTEVGPGGETRRETCAGSCRVPVPGRAGQGAPVLPENTSGWQQRPRNALKGGAGMELNPVWAEEPGHPVSSLWLLLPSGPSRLVLVRGQLSASSQEASPLPLSLLSGLSPLSRQPPNGQALSGEGVASVIYVTDTCRACLRARPRAGVATGHSPTASCGETSRCHGRCDQEQPAVETRTRRCQGQTLSRPR